MSRISRHTECITAAKSSIVGTLPSAMNASRTPPCGGELYVTSREVDQRSTWRREFHTGTDIRASSPHHLFVSLFAKQMLAESNYLYHGTLLRSEGSRAACSHMDRSLGGCDHLWVLFSVCGRSSQHASFLAAVPKYQREGRARK